jgi:hypothetical protein
MSRCYPADDIWYENKNIVEEAIKKKLKNSESTKEKKPSISMNLQEW